MCLNEDTLKNPYLQPQCSTPGLLFTIGDSTFASCLIENILASRVNNTEIDETVQVSNASTLKSCN